MRSSIRTLAGVAVALAVSSHGEAADGTATGTATGTLTYVSKGAPITAMLKYAWLVRGPDAVDAKKTIRHLILSSADIGPKVSACKTMSCTDADLGSGMTVDLDAGPRLNYWVSLNGQLVQYSGSARPEALELTTDTATRLAGRLTIDDSGAGGAKVDVTFDAQALPELKLAR